MSGHRLYVPVIFKGSLPINATNVVWEDIRL
jgi:hypothetical protein